MDRLGDIGDGFLTLAEAAERLGISRLKLREGIAKGVIAARRDNEGQWRVDLQDLPADVPRAVAAVTADPADLMHALFDEIADLGADLAQAQAMTTRIAALAGAQGEMIERLTDIVETRTLERDQLGRIADQALTAAEEAGGRATQLKVTADRAIGLLDRATHVLDGLQTDVARLSDESAAKDRVIADHGTRLERLFALSETALDKAGRDRPAPGLLARIFGTAR